MFTTLVSLAGVIFVAHWFVFLFFPYSHFVYSIVLIVIKKKTNLIEGGKTIEI